MRIGFLLRETEEEEEQLERGQGEEMSEMERLARECEREEERLGVGVMRPMQGVKSEHPHEEISAEVAEPAVLVKAEEEGSEQIQGEVNVKEELKSSFPPTTPPPQPHPPVFRLPTPGSPPPADAYFSWCTWISLWDTNRFFSVRLTASVFSIGAETRAYLLAPPPSRFPPRPWTNTTSLSSRRRQRSLTAVQSHACLCSSSCPSASSLLY
jgi:hypothetical protein